MFFRPSPTVNIQGETALPVRGFAGRVKEGKPDPRIPVGACARAGGYGNDKKNSRGDRRRARRKSERGGRAPRVAQADRRAAEQRPGRPARLVLSF